MTEQTNETDERAMQNVSHTNPNTGETFGYVYRRGPAVADGGQAADAVGGARTADGSADTARDAADAERTAMKDIDHTPPHGESANDVWVRGGSSRGEGVDE